MKKQLITLSLLAVALSMRADVIFTDNFNYTDGSLTNVAANIWYRHSGTANPSDSIVKNKKVEISASLPSGQGTVGGPPVSRQDDVNRKFTSNTNAQTLTYASFTVACTNLANIPAAGGYIAHHYALSSGSQLGRIYAVPGALSGTWRIGIAATAATVNKVFPVDLSTNVNYQVVAAYDPVNAFATLWVNPTSSADLSFQTTDPVTGTGLTAIINAYAFRQASGFGNTFFVVTNLATATTFDEAATNVWSTTPVTPIVATPPTSGTNFVGDTAILKAVAAGQGLGNLTYTWLKDGVGVSNPNGNSNVLTIASAAVADTGNYALVATTPYGLSVTSSLAFLWVTNAPIPPTITLEPVGGFVYAHQNKTLTVAATGPSPIGYQWYYNNAPLGDGPNISGSGSSTLQITDITTTDGTVGSYYCNVSNPYGNTNSFSVLVTVSNVPTVSIAYLRTLVDPTTYTSTNLSLVYNAIGTVTTFTNITTGNTSSYYLQDSTGCGINIFATLGSTFRPNQGDVVSFTGVLSSFNGGLELAADTSGNPATSYTVLSNNIAALPAAKVVPFSITNNNTAFMQTNVVGSIVMLTNVYFTQNTVFTNANGTNIVVTNITGQKFVVSFNTIDQDTAGRTLPAFAWSVVGPMVQSATNGGYAVQVTRFSDIVTDAPPAVVAGVTHTGSTSAVSWSDVVHDPLNYSYGSNYSYSVLSATSVTGPYTPLKTGLTFTNTAASYTDTSAGASQKFYQVVSP